MSLPNSASDDAAKTTLSRVIPGFYAKTEYSSYA
jgi:hypothetical protein